MRDAEIRSALVAHLHRQYEGDTNTLIRHEFGLCAGRARVDLAVINGEISGFEIKSDEDTLARLAGQASTYGRVLDRVTLVTTARYADRATALVPPWWGVWIAHARRAGIRLDQVRAGKVNDGVDAFAVAQLLWRDEAMQQLRDRGMHRGLSSARRWFVWLRLAEQVGLDELRTLVRDTLKRRQPWPARE